MSECRCCGAQMSSNICNYCGMKEVVALDESGEKILQSEAQNYKNSIINSITDISVVAYKLKMENKKILIDEENPIIIANEAKDCFNNYCLSDQCFESEQSDSSREMKLEYKVNGEKKEVLCRCALPETEKDWKVSVMLSENLKLNVRIGTESCFTEIKDIELDLKK